MSEPSPTYFQTVAALDDSGYNWVINKRSDDIRDVRTEKISLNTSISRKSIRFTPTKMIPSSFTTPTIAVTESVDTTIASKRGKKSTKVDFVRFDSTETIFKQTDQEDIVERAKIKDEIKS